MKKLVMLLIVVSIMFFPFVNVLAKGVLTTDDERYQSPPSDSIVSYMPGPSFSDNLEDFIMHKILPYLIFLAVVLGAMAILLNIFIRIIGIGWPSNTSEQEVGRFKPNWLAAIVGVIFLGPFGLLLGLLGGRITSRR